MILSAFAFFAGVLSLLLSPAAPPPEILECVALASLAAALMRRRPMVRALFWGCCGFLFATLHAHRYLESVWPTKLGGERVLAQAHIKSIPVFQGGAWTFDARLHIEAPEQFARALNARLISRESAVRPHVGERWRLLISLRSPRGALNPGSVDFERLLFHDRVHALGTIVSSRHNRRLEAQQRSLDALREHIARQIERQVTDRDAAALIAALAVGTTGSMSREQWRVFNATGTTHLVAISGMHITMLAAVMFAAGRALWRVWAWRVAPWTRENFAALLGLGTATGYAFLAGFSVPTQRTLLMLASWLLTRSLARAGPPLQPLAVALLAVLLLDPFEPLAAGFWLSFGAMGAILLVIQTQIFRRALVQEAVTVQLAVTAALIPFTLACFGSTSVLGPIVNAGAIPYISWLLVPVILLALALMPVSFEACNVALELAEHLHNTAWPWLVRAADSPLALVYASPPTWWYAIAAAALVVVLLPWPLALRTAAILCVLPLVAANRDPPRDGVVELTALDAGEGMAIVVRTARHALVFGTGESYGTEGKRVENVLLPFLRSRGLHVIDTLVIDQLTAVNGVGIAALLASMPVKQTLLGAAAAADFPGARACKPGETWLWSGARFKVTKACQLHIATVSGYATLSRSSLIVTDTGGKRWLIVPGGGKHNERKRSQFVGWRDAGTRVMATGDAGAIRAVLGSKDAVAPEGFRSVRRAIWRAEPP
jgi:competence protein ComEC